MPQWKYYETEDTTSGMLLKGCHSMRIPSNSLIMGIGSWSGVKK